MKHAALHAVPAALLACALASPARAAEVTVKFATVAPQDTPWERLLRDVKQRIQKDTGGVVRVQLFLGGVKGGEEALVRQCVQGSLQMIGVTTAALAQVVPELDALELPYLYDDYAQIDRMLAAATPQVTELLAKKGLVFYMWSENGWRGYASKDKPILAPGDLRGKKMRSQESRVHLQTWQALGASPVPIAVPEVLTALQTGVVDGYDNTPLYAFAASWYQGTKHYTVSDHIFQPALVVYNKRWFDGLPAGQQKVLLGSRDAHEAQGRKLIRALNDPLIDNFTAAGIQVHRLTADQKAAFARATRPVWDRTRKQTSADGRRLLDTVLKAKGK